jgi:hypothetical protein
MLFYNVGRSKKRIKKQIEEIKGGKKAEEKEEVKRT